MLQTKVKCYFSCNIYSLLRIIAYKCMKCKNILVIMNLILFVNEKRFIEIFIQFISN